MAYDFIAHDRRAVAGGIAILVAAIGIWVAWRQLHEDPVVREDRVPGTIRVAAAASAAPRPVVEVELADGRRVRVAVNTPAPKDGDAVTLQAFRHRSGAVEYFLAPEGRSGP